jgi:hypothetical protein
MHCSVFELTAAYICGCRFSGSTLEVRGITVETGEWAVVGGTGQFAMANGIISKKLHEQRSDGNVIELSVHAFCPLLKGKRVNVHIKASFICF